LARLKQISAMSLEREELLMKLGAARAKARAAWGLIDVVVEPDGAIFGFALTKIDRSWGKDIAIFFAMTAARRGGRFLGCSRRYLPLLRRGAFSGAGRVPVGRKAAPRGPMVTRSPTWSPPYFGRHSTL
jgi:hypothetical protein